MHRHISGQKKQMTNNAVRNFERNKLRREYSASSLQQLGLPTGVLSIDNKFFYVFMWVQ